MLDNTQYGFNTRFENGPGTNPEELIGAAHAGCFTMALSAKLGEAGMTARTAHHGHGLARQGRRRLHDFGRTPKPGGHHSRRQPGSVRSGPTAKEDCPVSKLLNAAITLDARLEN